MYKRYTLFILLFCVTTFAKAKDVAVPDISSAYLDRLITSAQSKHLQITASKNRIDSAKTVTNNVDFSWFNLFAFSYISLLVNTLNHTISYTTYANITNRFLLSGVQTVLSLNLVPFSSKPENVNVGKPEREIADKAESENLITLSIDVKRQYFTFLLQENRLRMKTLADQDMQNALKQAKYKLRKGEISSETYTTALLNVDESARQKLQAETNFFIAKNDLENLLGDKLENIK